MQYIDRPAYIEALSGPVRTGRVWTESKALRRVTDPELRDGIIPESGSCRHLRKRLAGRAPEPKSAVRITRNVIALLVHRTVMPPAEQRKIRERRGSTLRPVVEMVALGDANTAAWEAAAPIPMLERTPEGRGNGPGPCADRYDMPILPMAHHCAARVTAESSRRFRGNVCAVLQH